MSAPEFIFLNGQAIRVTSWQDNPDVGAHTLVVIARGSGDLDHLLSLLEEKPLLLKLPDEAEQEVIARDVSVRSTGEGQQAMHRIVAALGPASGNAEAAAPAGSRDATTPAPSVEDRLASIETRLDEIATLMLEIRADLRRGR